ncbi:Peroxiredoxin [Microbulbifer donghaiensis]|uniref:Peroxiredoxin n=1 Tax=Microbulbifer donghaiensis TaxID=494016 RepID=A0A1M4ZDD1_9GAMM|nr:redoxin domain-containing protein [Microbulbifer donghaiensis]SHF16063.1 Peroxiredoxin [Microbulbifer donghaiensis]
MVESYREAPEISASAWLNTEEPLSLRALRGKVVMVHAFQMLCPACVMQGTPQASAVAECFVDEPLQVIGLHSVFEHHRVMGVEALRVFVHEFRLAFPIAVDQAAENSAVPVTMQKLALRGTPSVVLIDKQGLLRFSHFGRLSDMQLGGMIGQLLAE